jgi:hypothetical protein
MDNRPCLFGTGDRALTALHDFNRFYAVADTDSLVYEKSLLI